MDMRIFWLNAMGIMTCINDYFHDHLYFYLDVSSDESTNAPSESKRINSHKPDVNPTELHIFLLLSLLSKKLSKEIPWTDSEPFSTDRSAMSSSAGVQLRLSLWRHWLSHLRQWVSAILSSRRVLISRN